MPSVKVRPGEDPEFALRRFKRACEKSGLITEVKRRQFYEKKTTERKRKLAAALKRNIKRMLRETPQKTKGKVTAPKKVIQRR